MMTMPASDLKRFEQSPWLLQMTLRKVTETLAHELAQPSAAAPDWSESEWTVARAAAAIHGVSPLLSRTLKWRGPTSWSEFLEQQRIQTAKRHARIDEVVRRLDERATGEGVAVLPLKGVALHAIGIYVPGERPMADVDILVRPRDAERTKHILESLGFYEARASWKERVFLPTDGHLPGSLGEHSDNDVKIELHERIGEKLPWRLTDISERLFPVQSRPGMNAYPSQASLMIHLLLHAAGAMAFQALRLLQLHDIVLLAQRMANADWDEVLRPGNGGQRPWWAFPPLELASKYYPSRIPKHVLMALKNECPRLLARVSRRKTLCDVSFSHLWIDAFPGIEWSRSASEMASYVINRVKPNATQIALRGTAAKMEIWASADRWVAMSQGRRIIRWVMSRQARSGTLYVVKAAFGQLP